MTGETTSLPARETAREEWASLRGFVRKPALPAETSQGWSAGFRAVFRILALDLLVMAALMLLAGAVTLIGVDLPETALAGIEIDWTIVAMVVLAAPALEELAFRGWLSGKPGHVAAVLIILGGGIVAAVLAADLIADEATAATRLTVIVSLALAAIAWAVLRKRAPMRWFQATFPVMYWLSVIAFAVIHLLNFEEAGASLLPLVLPQFLLGMMLGYLRVNYGLWSSILLHVMHNGLIISLVMIASASSS